MTLKWLNKNKLLIGVVSVPVILVAIGVILHVYNPDLAGFSSGFTTNTERDAAGKTTKTIEIEQSSKTYWDLLSLVVVPLSLALLGYWFQRREQRRADERAEREQKRADEQTERERERATEQAQLEREIAQENRREEVLQAYFDRLSTLLIDKSLIEIANRFEKNIYQENYTTEYVSEKRELLDAAVGVIRARTLSVLRQLGEDRERKKHVIQFLLETDVIHKLKMSFSYANLSGIDLNHINLSTIDFNHADLSGANLGGADLSGANLSDAKLNNASLLSANLTNANLEGAVLRKDESDFSIASMTHVNLSNANLSFANLSHATFNGANFSGAKFEGAILRGAVFNGANFSGANLTGAVLNNANLAYADLSQVKVVTKGQLENAKLCQTKLPDGIDLNHDRDCEKLGVTTNQANH